MAKARTKSERKLLVGRDQRRVNLFAWEDKGARCSHDESG